MSKKQKPKIDETEKPHYLPIGDGGYVIGVKTTDSGSIVYRDEVAGSYESTDGGKTFKKITQSRGHQ